MIRAELKSRAKAQISGKLGILFLCYLVMTLIIAGCNIVLIIGSIASLILAPILGISFNQIYLNLTKDKYPEVGDLFKNMKYIWKALGLSVLVVLIVLAGTLVLIIPGIILSFALSQSFYLLADNPEMSVTDAISTSMTMMKGHKWEYFVLQLSFLGWILLGCLTFYILTFAYVMPYMYATNANYYYYLKDEYMKNFSTPESGPDSTSQQPQDNTWEIK